jgi:hypothetical protein
MAAMNRTRWLLIVLSTALLAACATGKPDSNALDRTLYAYAGAIRWGQLEEAMAALDPEALAERRPTELALERLRQIQVTGYYVQASNSLDDGRLAQTVEIRFINRHTQAEHSMIDRQIWRWDDRAERWWLTTGLPDITERR